MPALFLLLISVNFAAPLSRDSVLYPPVALGQQLWATFYYPWYGGDRHNWAHWDENRHVPNSATPTWASNYLPDDGDETFSPITDLYDSMDAKTIDRHLAEMNEMHLNFAIVDWWGPGSYADQAFNAIGQRVLNNSWLPLRLVIVYEESHTHTPTASDLVSNLTYIYDNYAGKSFYGRVPDVAGHTYPVVFVYPNATNAHDYASRWNQARYAMWAAGKPIFIVQKVWSKGSDSYLNHAEMADGWYQYSPNLRYDLQEGYSVFASPGYWEYPELAAQRGGALGSPVLQRNVTAFQNAVQTMKNLPLSKAKFLLIETFNEWHEGTQVEPGYPTIHGYPHNSTTNFKYVSPSYGDTYLLIVGNIVPPLFDLPANIPGFWQI